MKIDRAAAAVHEAKAKTHEDEADRLANLGLRLSAADARECARQEWRLADQLSGRDIAGDDWPFDADPARRS